MARNVHLGASHEQTSVLELNLDLVLLGFEDDSVEGATFEANVVARPHRLGQIHVVNLDAGNFVGA